MSEERKWRKKPVVISAVQYRSDSPAEIDGVTTAYKNVYNGTISPIDQREPFEGDWVPIAAIKTMEGWHEVADGDWVITGVSGEKYPCKPKEFALTYEPAAEFHRESSIDRLREAGQHREKPTIQSLTAQLDEIRGILGHPGTNKLPVEASAVDLVRYAHHQWLETQHAAEQRTVDAESKADSLTAQLAEAARYATSLAVYLRDKFYPEVTQWQPLNDLLGVLSQIDNMIAGLVKPTSSDALARYKAMEEVAKAVVEVKGDIANYCCMCACHDICDTCRVTRFRQALTKLQEVPHDPTD
jgi:hypothetical protein